jgi:ABC-2 type transport system permease protein
VTIARTAPGPGGAPPATPTAVPVSVPVPIAGAAADEGEAGGEAPVELPAKTTFPSALGAVYVGQLARARVARVPLLFVASLQSLGILLLLRGVVDTTDAQTASQVVAGSTVLVVAFVALNLLAQRFGMLRAGGGLDYYRAVPIPLSAVVLGTAASYATFAVPGTIVTAVVGAALYDLPMAGLWVLLPVAAVAGAALAGIGATLGLLASRPELATVAGQLAMSVVLFLGIIPAGRMPAPVRLARDLLPSSYATDALAAALRPAPAWGGVAADLAVCAGAAVAALLAAAVAMRRAGTA